MKITIEVNSMKELQNVLEGSDGIYARKIF